MQSTNDAHIYRQARKRARRQPRWWLRRRETRIVAQKYPSKAELAELAAIRQELSIRAISHGWWFV